MCRLAFLVLALVAASSAALAQGRPPRFWNLTGETISEFYLAPAGTTDWGTNQCKNDRDGTVDPDERLNITGVQPGSYDAKLADVTGARISRGPRHQGGGRADFLDRGEGPDILQSLTGWAGSHPLPREC